MAAHTTNRATFILLVVMGAAVFSPSGPAEWLSGIVAEVVAPVSDPMLRAAEAMRRPRSPIYGTPASVDDEELRALLEQQQARVRNLESEVVRLNQLLREFQAFAQSDAMALFRPIRARRTMTASRAGSRSFRVLAGSRHGVDEGIVAVAEVYQLVGRVTSVDLVSAVVMPIIEQGAGSLGVVYLATTETPLGSGIEGTLSPAGDGTLSGYLDATSPVTEGAAVRLMDESWGREHNGLLVGYVTDVSRYDRRPEHVQVVVTPSLDLSRLSHVMLRIPRDQPGGP